MAQKRLPEDSVLDSISQVQEMLREDTRPAPRARAAPAARPVAQVVPEEVVGGVPSMAEITATRELRWRAEEQLPRPATAPAPQTRWGLWAAAVTGVVIVAGLGTFFALRSSPAPQEAPAPPPVAEAPRPVEPAVAAPPAPVSLAEAPASVAAPTSTAPAKRGARKASGRAEQRDARTAQADRADRAPPSRKARKPSTKTDKSLSSLIDGL